MPPLVGVLFDDDDQPTRFSRAYRSLFLANCLRIRLLEAEREVPICCGLDVVPIRGAGRNPPRSKCRSRVVKFDVAQGYLAVVLNGDVDA